MANVIFIQDSWIENLGIMSLSAVLKQAGHNTILLVGNIDKVIKKLYKIEKDIICFSIISGQENWFLELSKKIKDNFQVKIVAGGIFPTLFKEFINEKNIDVICIGEGEIPLLELVNSYDKRQNKFNNLYINNLYIKQNGKIYKNRYGFINEDLNKLPMLDRDLYYKSYKEFEKNPNKHFIGSRGCVYSCSYCYNSNLKKMVNCKKFYRLLSPENFIKEIEYVKNNYTLKKVIFEDDSLASNKKWLKQFLKLYRKKIKLPFICYLTANDADEERVKLLKKSGAEIVFFAIETANENYRLKILKKPVKNKAIYNASKNFHKYRLKFIAIFMFLLPGETLKMALLNLKMAWKIKATDYRASIFQPYKNLELTNYSKKIGVLNNNYKLEKNFFKNSVLKNKDKNEIINLYRFFYIFARYRIFFILFKKIIYIKTNEFFYYIYLAIHAYYYNKFIGKNLLFTIKEGFWHIFEKK